MEDAELHSKKKSAFLAKINKPVTAAPKKAGAEPAQADPAQEAKILELEAQVSKLTAENAELANAKPKPAHNLNLKSKPVLGYWNIRGLAAPLRYLMYYCGVEFEDKQYACGPGPDFDKSSWLNEKFTLGLALPNLPYLIDEEVKLTETLAIAKYICAKWMPELLISDPVHFGLNEMLSSTIMKLKEVSTMPCYQGKTNQEIMDECWPLI